MIARAITTAIIVGACALASPACAQAEGARVDQVEWLEIEADTTEAESQTIWDNGEEEGLKTGLTLERGLSERLSLGVELEWDRRDSGALALDEISLQAKLALIERAARGWGAGVQPALVIDRRSGAVGSETFFILETAARGWALAGNVIVNSEPGDWNDWQSGYALRAQRQISDALLLGIESGGTIAGFDRPGHWLGPVLALSPGGEGKGLAAELSAFAGLAPDTPDVQLRLALRWGF